MGSGGVISDLALLAILFLAGQIGWALCLLLRPAPSPKQAARVLGRKGAAAANAKRRKAIHDTAAKLDPNWRSRSTKAGRAV